FKGNKVKAIRHVINPSLTYRFSPDFGNDRFGYYQRVIRERTNQTETQLLSRYNGMLYNAPSPFPQSALGFSVANSVEMKKVSKNDSITGFEKVKIIDNLTASSRYNFAADSFKIDVIRVSMFTNLFNRLSVNMYFNFDPYQYVNNRRIDQLQINRGGLSLARFTDASIDLSTDLNPENWKREKRASANNYPIGDETQPTRFPEASMMPEYVDFNIKWSLWVGFNASYINPKYQDQSPAQTRNFNFRGTVNPSEKWRVAFSSGYDIMNKEVTFTKIDLYRDLHCWEMSIGWTPFGYAQGYYVNINVKSSMLRDLKISQNRTYYNR